MAKYNQILVAIDYSNASGQVVERAIELVDHNTGLLRLIHVVEPVIVDPGYEGMPGLYLEVEEQLRQIARDQMDRWGDRYEIDSSRRHLTFGTTKGEIFRCAEANSVDLIVIGSHGRHGVGLLLGSTANAILHGAPCDVLAVRIKD